MKNQFKKTMENRFRRMAAAFILLSTGLPVVNAQWKIPTPKASVLTTSQEVYLYNVEAGQFFCGGNDWDSRASVGEKGYRVKLYAEGDGLYSIGDYNKGGDNAWQWCTLYIDGPSSLWVNNTSWDDRAIWQFEETSPLTYHIMLHSSAKYTPTNGFCLGLNSIKSDTRLYYVDGSQPSSLASWRIVSPNDYNNYFTDMQCYNRAQELNDLLSKAESQGIDVSGFQRVYDNTSSTLEELTTACNGIRTILKPYISFTEDTLTGGLTALRIGTDTTQMNWILQADGSQYSWVTSDYQWGLGRVSVDGTTMPWKNPQSRNGDTLVYAFSNKAELLVDRHVESGDLMENYTFRNTSDRAVSLSNIDIYTPMNDNYPSAEECISRRVNAHVWAGGSDAYICGLRMGGYSPHIGLALTSGNVSSYSIRLRGNDKGSSNFRGVICLNPANITLQPGEEYTLSWRVFAHQGIDDFYAKLKSAGDVVAESGDYVYELGDEAVVRFHSEVPISVDSATISGSEAIIEQQDSMVMVKADVKTTGPIRLTLYYNNGRSTWAELWGVSSIDSLLSRRAHFITSRQQYNDATSAVDGAYLPYDTETQQQYLNWKASWNRDDLDEGAERVGMGLFLSLYLQQHPDATMLSSLQRYTSFLRTQLQEPDYKTWEQAPLKGRHRAYNYVWIAHLYLEMFNLTGDMHYLRDAYGTMKALYRNFDHNFYSIGTPVEQSITLFRQHGMVAEADTLLGHYREVAANFIKNGVHFPVSEVNYEQSIVAPAVTFLEEMYLVTREESYLTAARQMLPVLEAFGGRQPSVHLNDISLRHWDGYWFGKYQRWGDTMPHYWSTLTADAYAAYARCTGDSTYSLRARNILRNNLCLFFEDGGATCAWIYPHKVDDADANFADPLANDQDNALAYLLIWQRQGIDCIHGHGGGETLVESTGDVTPLVFTNPSFELGPSSWLLTKQVSGWQDISVKSGEAPDGNRRYNLWAASVGSFSLGQKVVLPAGEYTLTAQLMTNVTGLSDQHLFVKTLNDSLVSRPLSKAGTWQTLSLDFSIGRLQTVTLGAASNGDNNTECGWFAVDNFRLFRKQATEVSNVRNYAHNSLPSKVYDLQGRAYSCLPQSHGIYVVKGKKIIQ